MNYRVVLNLLGKVLLIEAAFMALPILVALLYQESSWIYFLLPMLGAGMVGCCCPDSMSLRNRCMPKRDL